jgi:hypothetical protein
MNNLIIDFSIVVRGQNMLSSPPSEWPERERAEVTIARCSYIATVQYLLMASHQKLNVFCCLLMFSDFERAFDIIYYDFRKQAVAPIPSCTK